MDSNFTKRPCTRDGNQRKFVYRYNMAATVRHNGNLASKKPLNAAISRLNGLTKARSVIIQPQETVHTYDHTYCKAKTNVECTKGKKKIISPIPVSPFSPIFPFSSSMQNTDLDPSCLCHSKIPNWMCFWSIYRLCVSYPSATEFSAIIFLLFARSSSNWPRSFQRSRRTLRQNFNWICQRIKNFPIDPNCKNGRLSLTVITLPKAANFYNGGPWGNSLPVVGLEWNFAP